MNAGDAIFLGILGYGLLLLVLSGIGLNRDPMFDSKKLSWIPRVSVVAFGAAALVVYLLSGGWSIALALGAMVGVLAGNAVVGIMVFPAWREYRRNRRKGAQTDRRVGDCK